MAKISSANLRRPRKPLTPAGFRRQAAPHLRVIKARANTTEEKAAKLGAYYSVGQMVLKQTDGRFHYADKRIIQFAEAVGHQSSWLYKLREFSREYDSQELEELCQHADHANFAHVIQLLRLSKSNRAVYLERTEARKWKPSDLARAIRTDFNKEGTGGRSIVVPENASDAVTKLLGEGDRWRRQCAKVKEKLKEDMPQWIRKRLQKQAKEAKKMLQEIADAAVELKKELKGRR